MFIFYVSPLLSKIIITFEKYYRYVVSATAFVLSVRVAKGLQNSSHLHRLFSNYDYIVDKHGLGQKVETTQTHLKLGQQKVQICT